MGSQLRAGPSAGVALTIIGSRETLFTGAYGFASLDAQTPLRSDHLFQIGSIGKSFTAIALLQLLEAGLLALHEPVNRYLPWLVIPSDYGAITLHHLLTHSAGIVRGSDAGPSMHGEAWSLRDTRAGAPPGQYFRYSNCGYMLLGLVLEAVTGHYTSYNPWNPGFRVFLRKRQLVLSDPLEGEQPLTEIGPVLFPVGEKAHSPETVRFEAIVDGQATLAIESGSARFYRAFTP